jgi:hypothetical protein
MNIIVKGIRYIANIGDCYKTLFPYTGVKFKVTGLIKWEFEYTLFVFQDELVDRLLFIKDKIFLKH